MATDLIDNLRADRVSRLRPREAVCVGTSALVSQAVDLMAERGVGCVLVVETGEAAGAGGKLVGIFTERDFVSRVMTQSRDMSTRLCDVMTSSPRSVTESASVLAAIEAMGEGGHRHMPVIDDAGRPVGVLSVKDVMHYLVEYFPARVYNLPPKPSQTQPAREGA